MGRVCGHGADTLRTHCRSALAGYKVPGRFVFAQIPRTSTGKIQKFVLRETARELGAPATEGAGDQGIRP